MSSFDRQIQKRAKHRIINILLLSGILAEDYERYRLAFLTAPFLGYCLFQI
jgi:hypothetical protein